MLTEQTDSAVFNTITRDLSGRERCLVEGVFLHFMPVLMLTEYQSERFFWVELRRMISADIYLNGKKLDLNLRLIRPYLNRMYVALTENKNTSGIYLPVSASGEYDLCVEWRICFSGKDQRHEYITHTQKIVITPSADEHASSKVYSVLEASYDNRCATNSSESLETYACSDFAVSKPRADLFGTSVVRKGNHLAIYETVKISRVLDLKRAAFFKPLLHCLGSKISQEEESDADASFFGL